MTSTTHIKQMITSTSTATAAKENFLKGFATSAVVGIMGALAPLAIVTSIAAMNVPAAEAGTTICNQIGNSVQCHSF